jgi:branched-chain amino acid transport system ATP-binding protein
MLEVEDLHAYYGTSHILHGVRLAVGHSQGVALLGRNGAGKSTTLKAITALGPRWNGRVSFRGRSLHGLRTYQIARLGIGYVPEDRRIYPHLTVEENLEIGRVAFHRRRPTMAVDEIWSWFPLLKDLRRRRGRELSGGEQQMLSVARSLVAKPDLMLLDEPTEGLAPLVVESLQTVIRGLLSEVGVGLLLAEQNMKFALRLTDYVFVIDGGHLVFEGRRDEFGRRADLQHKYLAV